jgi:hypothetical protein
MDVAVLRGRIVATLDADADARRRAELDLKTVKPNQAKLSGPCANHNYAGRGACWIHRCPSRYLAS